jgi:preprotein translocase subunit SecD
MRSRDSTIKPASRPCTLRSTARARASSSKLTRENVGKRMAMVLIERKKAEVVTAPVIRQEIGGGRVQISGAHDHHRSA